MRTWIARVTLGLTFCTAGLVGAADVETLTRQLQNTDVDERRRAAKEIGELGAEAKSAAPALIALLKKDKDSYVRRYAALSLGQVGANPKAAVPALRDALKEGHKDLSEAVVTALGKMGADGVPPLIEVLRDKPAPATKAKAKKKTDSPFDSTAAIRARAAKSLGEIGPPAKAAVPALTEALKDPATAFEAITALGNIGPEAKTAVPALKEAAAARPAKKNRDFRNALNEAIRKIERKS